MKNHIPNSKKPPHIQLKINEALEILEALGIPLDCSERRKERMAVCFMAVSGVTNDWSKARYDLFLRSRDIISFVNKNFEENISPGSYDDIRRQDLKLLVLGEMVINSGTENNFSTNSPTRAYAIHPDVQSLLIHYGTDNWSDELEKFKKGRLPLVEVLARRRDIKKIPVTLPDGKPIELSMGEHNILQKAIVEEFLPRFGKGCKVLYLGDTSHKLLHIEVEILKKIGFFELSHDELPDVIAFDAERNWLFLIEALVTSGPMSEVRLHELKSMLKACTAELIFVTAFLKRDDFRKWMPLIGWETEVWIMESPDHLIHFNGHKFLGPYK
ncbi:MAG TPA: BsuBI/PstI family type II restriction endonuclease [Bacteroidales bacterium]|nr:BsuBI/PstI family type II restriction endonuclease [Bacteroidales bacterium]